MPPEESPESKFDRLKKQLQDSILRDYPNPERKGCPGGAVLQELAERPLDQPSKTIRTGSTSRTVPSATASSSLSTTRSGNRQRPAGFASVGAWRSPLS